MSPQKRRIADDPLRRPCPVCRARIGQGCKTVGNNAKPLVPKNARLVHADRLKETETHA